MRLLKKRRQLKTWMPLKKTMVEKRDKSVTHRPEIRAIHSPGFPPKGAAASGDRSN
jgi:hypothetical protein